MKSTAVWVYSIVDWIIIGVFVGLALKFQMAIGLWSAAMFGAEVFASSLNLLSTESIEIAKSFSEDWDAQQFELTMASVSLGIGYTFGFFCSLFQFWYYEKMMSLGRKETIKAAVRRNSSALAVDKAKFSRRQSVQRANIQTLMQTGKRAGEPKGQFATKELKLANEQEKAAGWVKEKFLIFLSLIFENKGAEETPADEKKEHDLEESDAAFLLRQPVFGV